ncbi:MAG: YtxH domain-containing protein [Acidobacteriota bacterium]|nr:YtxH domain-containing protein [Acidobacteriota bacterium]
MSDKDYRGYLWFLAGAVVGASVALLYAPKSGEDARKYLGQVSEETGKDIVDKGKELYDRGRQLADEAADLFERGRKMVQG